MQHICYHVAAFKSPEGETQVYDRKSCLICFIFIVPLSACEISIKNIDNLLSYCKYLTFDPT